MNGKGAETLRWVAALVLSGLVSYFTALGSVKERIGRVEEREENHYSELMRMNSELIRKVDRIESKIDNQRDYGFRLGQQP